MASLLSGQITVATAGTAVAGPAAAVGGYFAIKAHPANVGVVWFGDDGSGNVDANSGFPLSAGEAVEVYVTTLAALRFNAVNNGDKFCWYRVQ